MQTTIGFNLLDVPEFNNILANNSVEPQILKVVGCFTKSNQKYTIVKYNKYSLSNDTIHNYGLFRSVIINSINKVVCFSPPKSFSLSSFQQLYPSMEKLVVQEFVEGTMMNVFWDSSIGLSGGWEISTRNVVGAETTFYKKPNSKTFQQMFLEACKELQFDINTLNKELCYSFVLQHPDNRIVVPLNKMNIYLIEAYKIVYRPGTIMICPQPIQSIASSLNGISVPQQYSSSSYEELIKQYGSGNTPYHTLGVVIKNCETGERCKIRNPIYEEVRYLKGNQPKLQYQYLCLRKEGKVKDFLQYYPETKYELSVFRDQLHLFTHTLFQNYIQCYIRKEKPLINYPPQFKTHMFQLHQLYMNELREKKLYVTNGVVVKYINSMHPSQLMFVLNHHMKKRFVETICLE